MRKQTKAPDSSRDNPVQRVGIARSCRDRLSSARRDGTKETIPLDPQSRVPRQHLEVSIIVENRGALSNGDGRDQAVHQLADCHTPNATGLLSATQPVRYAPWSIRADDLEAEAVRCAVDAVRRGQPLPRTDTANQLAFDNSTT